MKPRARVTRRILVTVGALAGSLLLTAAPAHATTTSVSATVGGSYTYYTTARTITANGSNIYLKVDPPGVAMKVFWYKCSDRGVRGAAVEVGSGARKLIGSNFAAGTAFCLAAAADVSETRLPWRGTLYWNVYS